MVKKVVKKKVSKKKPVAKKKTVRKQVIRSPKIPKDDAKLGKILIENFVGLQKVMVNLSVKFDDLSNKLSKLLDLFEISAKALAEKDLTIEKTARDDDRIIKEIGNLSGQNKVIARGLTLMHDRLSGEESREEPSFQLPPPQRAIPRAAPTAPRTAPRVPRTAPTAPKTSQAPPMRKPMPAPPTQERKTIPNNSPMEGYQKSIASEPFKKLPT